MLLRPKLLCAIGVTGIMKFSFAPRVSKTNAPTFLFLISSPLLELIIQETAGKREETTSIEIDG